MSQKLRRAAGPPRPLIDRHAASCVSEGLTRRRPGLVAHPARRRHAVHWAYRARAARPSARVPQARFPTLARLMHAALALSGVTKRYAGHLAVANLSLIVPAGSVYGLLGPNGAGKTTTIRMVLNVLAPDEGTIEVLGVPNTTPNIIDRVGYLR